MFVTTTILTPMAGGTTIIHSINDVPPAVMGRHTLYKHATPLGLEKNQKNITARFCFEIRRVDQWSTSETLRGLKQIPSLAYFLQHDIMLLGDQRNFFRIGLVQITHRIIRDSTYYIKNTSGITFIIFKSADQGFIGQLFYFFILNGIYHQ